MPFIPSTEIIDEDRELLSGIHDGLNLFRTTDLNEGRRRIAQFMKDVDIIGAEYSMDELMGYPSDYLQGYHINAQRHLMFFGEAVDHYLGKPTMLHDDEASFVHEVTDFMKPENTAYSMKYCTMAEENGFSDESLNDLFRRLYHYYSIQDVMARFSQLSVQRILAGREIPVGEYKAEYPLTSTTNVKTSFDPAENPDLISVIYANCVTNVALVAVTALIGGEDKHTALAMARAIPLTKFTQNPSPE
jgi:hypothetical protein